MICAVMAKPKIKPTITPGNPISCTHRAMLLTTITGITRKIMHPIIIQARNSAISNDASGDNGDGSVVAPRDCTYSRDKTYLEYSMLYLVRNTLWA
jgi:transposase